MRILFRGDEILRDVGGSAGQRLVAFSAVIARFVRAGIKIGAVSPDVDVVVVAGLLHDRLVNQAAFAPMHKKHQGTLTLDATYRARWVKANLRIVLHGILSPTDDSS